MAVLEGYSPRNRAERVISAARLFVAIFMVVAMVLEPADLLFTPHLFGLTFWYLFYAAGVAILTWSRVITTRGVPIATHLIDLVWFSIFMYLTEGPTSPFFVYFVFATICGAIRWQGRGALLTGGGVLATYIFITLMATGSGAFHAGRFIVRCVQLAIVAGLLSYLGTYQRRLQREITGLAEWPRRLPTGSEALQEVPDLRGRCHSRAAVGSHLDRGGRAIAACGQQIGGPIRIVSRSA